MIAFSDSFIFVRTCTRWMHATRPVCVWRSEDTLQELLWYSLSVPGIELRLGDLVTGAFCCWIVSKLTSTLLWVPFLFCDSSVSLICLCYSLPCIFKRIPQSCLLFPFIPVASGPASLWFPVSYCLSFSQPTNFARDAVPVVGWGSFHSTKQKWNNSLQVSNSELLCHRRMDQTCKPRGFCL